MAVWNKGELERILGDCLYATTYARYKQNQDVLDRLAKAGYIYEPRTEVDEAVLGDVSLLSMPIKNVSCNGLPSAVIVSTGSYSPIHEGHIGIMDVSREYVEQLGYQVVQGVISASHDTYVSKKYQGEAKMHVGIRSQRILEAIDSSEWLTLDRLEGEMVSCAINFSSVLKRVRDYLIRHHPHVDADTPIFYVFGSDNAGFCDAFVGNATYHGICVKRGDESLCDLEQQYKGHANIHFVSHSETFRHQSSSLVRKKSLNEISKSSDITQKIYIVRADDVPNVFADRLAQLIAEHTQAGVRLKVVCAEDFRLPAEPFVSMDKKLTGQYPIDVSRVFELCSGQILAKGITSFSEPLECQTSAIPVGQYILLDDDSITGFSMDHVESALKKAGSTVTRREMLIDQMLDGNPLFDVVDAKDFFIPSSKGGLAVEFNGRMMRAPYIFPFVNLVSRASILPELQHVFSKKLYELNMEFCEEMEINDTLDEKFIFFKNASNHKTVGDFCRKNAEILENFLATQ